jgi:uncharacterized protein DUF1801
LAPKALTDLLRRYEADVRLAAIALRSVVLGETGPCHETVLQVYRNNVVSILYSTTEKQIQDNICLIVVYRDHVNLLFPRGADLKDPRGLLEGTGKAMRHVKIFSVADVGRPGVCALVSQARRRPGLGKPPRPLRRVTTTVKGKDRQATAPPAQPARPRLF